MNTYFRENKPRLVLGITRNLDFPPHIHEELELVWMQEGTCTAYCAGQRYVLHPGDFFLAFPEQVHSYEGSENCQANLIIVHPGQLGGLSDILKRETPVCPVYTCQEADLLQLLALTVQEHSTYADKTITLPLLTATIGKLLKHYTFRTQPAKDSAAEQIIKYCSLHYKEPLGMEGLSKALYLSQSHISHTFSQKLKISFSDYVNSLRLDEAVRLLEQTSHSMEEIAERSGFPTVRTFNRVFRKKFDISPSEYRKSSL